MAPAEVLVSIEADIFSLRDSSDNDLIDGSIGEGSLSTKPSATTRMELVRKLPFYPLVGRID